MNKNRRLIEYLKEEISKKEKEAHDLLNDVLLLEFSMKENLKNYELINGSNLYDSFKRKEYEKLINKQQENIEIKKLKLELAISTLASKKANLHWIDDGSDDTEEQD